MPKSKPESEKMRRINIWLSPDLEQWLTETVDKHNEREPHNPINTSAYIRNVLAKVRDGRLREMPKGF